MKLGWSKFPDVASQLVGGEIQGVEIHAVDVERVVEFRG